MPTLSDTVCRTSKSREKPFKLSDGGGLYRHRLRMDRLDDRVRRRGQEAVDQVGTGIGFDLVPR
jgi:hypothetical protein